MNLPSPEPKLVPGGLASTLTMAALTWKRLLRGRAIMVALLIALIPVAYVGVAGRGVGAELFVFELLVTAVLAPMFVASSIGEDIEDRTTTYLWSRPIQRWAIVTGKLLALVPAATAVVLASWIFAANLAWHELPPARTSIALAVGVAAISVLSAAIASLAPRHGMALSIVYVLFFDSPLGVLPATLRELSITHQVRTLAGGFPTETATQQAGIALAIMTALWGTLAAWRMRRLEA
jgi:ABC-type Na+ efflux pump permease subunit